MPFPLRTALCALLPLTLVSCSSNDSSSFETVTVLAAASLADAFTDIGEAFEAEHPGSRIEFNFASSSDLATQILEGAPADIFASADTKNVDRVRDGAVAVSDAITFATNSLEIIVESGNPKGIGSLIDLADPNLIYVTCDVEVPIGRYSAEILTRAGVTVTPASFEENVKGIVNKVVLGEADAGIVYRTDVIAAGSTAAGIAIPSESNITVQYPIVMVGETPSTTARDFIAFVTTSPAARAILERYGFEAP